MMSRSSCRSRSNARAASFRSVMSATVQAIFPSGRTPAEMRASFILPSVPFTLPSSPATLRASPILLRKASRVPGSSQSPEKSLPGSSPGAQARSAAAIGLASMILPASGARRKTPSWAWLKIPWYFSSSSRILLTRSVMTAPMPTKKKNRVVAPRRAGMSG
jgi:hypothetical protein